MNTSSLLAGFTLRQLTYFAAAAEAGTTTAAAERLYMGQSSLSAALTELETGLGVQLFVRRRGKGLELTSTGRALLPEARALIRAAEEFGARAHGLQEGLHGQLSVGCFDTIAPAVLPPLLTGFQDACPDVRVDFMEGDQADLQDSLLDGRTELCIMYDHELLSGMASAVLQEPAPHVLLARGHPLAARSSIALAELSAEPFVMITSQPARTLIRRTFAEAGVVPQVRHRSGNFDHVRALVHHGLGCTMISQVPGSLPSHWDDGIAAVPVSDPVTPHHVLLVWLEGARLSRRARAFRDFCVPARA